MKFRQCLFFIRGLAALVVTRHASKIHSSEEQEVRARFRNNHPKKDDFHLTDEMQTMILLLFDFRWGTWWGSLGVLC